MIIDHPLASLFEENEGEDNELVAQSPGIEYRDEDGLRITNDGTYADWLPDTYSDNPDKYSVYDLTDFTNFSSDFDGRRECDESQDELDVMCLAVRSYRFFNMSMRGP